MKQKGVKGMKLFEFAINSYLIQLGTACIHPANVHQGVSCFEIYSKYVLKYTKKENFIQYYIDEWVC